MKKTDPPIIVEEIFKSSLPLVWAALTEHEQMLKWYFDNIEDFKAEVGFETTFKTPSGDRVFTHQWRVTEVIPLQKISYQWNYAEYAGDSVISFELFEKEKDVRLQVTVDVLEDFPSDIPEFKRESCIGGWQYFIGQQLKQYLDTL